MRKSNITMTDLFCGCGGSSSGAMEAAATHKLNSGTDVELRIALNHWARAIETHQLNFPDTYHESTDVQACDPRRFESTDILMASPECTNHSLAKGQKKVKEQLSLYEKLVLDPAAERSRATMWDVVRFAEVHKYRYIITENVCDAHKWVLFDSWLKSMMALGYEWEIVSLNSMFCHPTPQSRDRMYVVFWRKGHKKPDLRIMPRAYCPKCEKDVDSIQRWKANRKVGKYKQQYDYCCPTCATSLTPYYYAAFNAIDWSDLGKRIGDRTKPLSDNTMRRIRYGLDKYAEPFFLHTSYGKEARGIVKHISKPLMTQTTFKSQAICNPFIVNSQYSTGLEFRVKGVEERLPTIPTEPHLGIATPFISMNEHSKAEPQIRSVKDSMQTQTTRQSMALIVPFLTEMHRTGKARSATDALNTVTSGGIKNGIVSHESMKTFLTYYYGQDQASHVTEVSGTVTTKERMAMVGIKPNIEDCLYRMLKPKEIQKAMAFSDSFQVTGSGKEQVKQAGNAVTPPAMRILQERVLATFL